MVDIEILPRVFGINGKAASIREGKYTATDLDLEECIKEVVSKYDKALLEDLNGLYGTMPQLEFLKKVERYDVWVDAGVRRCGGAMDVLVAGASRVIMRSLYLKRLGELEDAVKMSPNVVFQIDFNHSLRANSMELRLLKPYALLREARMMGIETFTFLSNDILSSKEAKEEMRKLLPSEEAIYFGIVHKEDFSIAERFGVKRVIAEAEELIVHG